MRGQNRKGTRWAGQLCTPAASFYKGGAHRNGLAVCVPLNSHVGTLTCRVTVSEGTLGGDEVRTNASVAQKTVVTSNADAQVWGLQPQSREGKVCCSGPPSLGHVVTVAGTD